MRLLPVLMAIACFAAPLAAPAAARLGEPVRAIERSSLVKGNGMFRFEARIGDRYRFTGARHCLFGNGLMCLDTYRGRVVQQVLVLPLPANEREERRLKWIAELFLKEAGLDPQHRKSAMEAFEHSFKTAKRVDKKLGSDYEFRTYCDPHLNGIMMVVGLKP